VTPDSAHDAPAPSPGGALTVGEVLAKLAARYPLEDAEPWDRVGLLTGDPAGPATHIVCALDPCAEALQQVFGVLEADVLVTHHPTYLRPEPGDVPAYGLTLESMARSNGVALLAFHTNLDVSEPARLTMGTGLPLRSRGTLADMTDPADTSYEHPRFAQVWEPCEALTITQVADLLAQHYQAPVRLMQATAHEGPLTKVATATGAGGDALDAAIEAGVELLITGELKYHQLVEARDRGLSCIELGHDVSEWPLAALLHDTLVEECGDRGATISLLPRDLFSRIVTTKGPTS